MTSSLLAVNLTLPSMQQLFGLGHGLYVYQSYSKLSSIHGFIHLLGWMNSSHSSASLS